MGMANKTIEVQHRGFLTPYFMKTPLYCLPPIFQILSLFDKQRNTAHIAHPGVKRMTNSYKYIVTPPVMWTQQLSLLH